MGARAGRGDTLRKLATIVATGAVALAGVWVRPVPAPVFDSPVVLLPTIPLDPARPEPGIEPAHAPVAPHGRPHRAALPRSRPPDPSEQPLRAAPIVLFTAPVVVSSGPADRLRLVPHAPRLASARLELGALAIPAVGPPRAQERTGWGVIGAAVARGGLLTAAAVTRAGQQVASIFTP